MYEKTEPFPQGPGPVLRLTVELRDGTWSVIARTVVDRMTVPASQPAPDPGRAGRVSGLWFEVVDDSGRVRYRSGVAEPVPAVEVHRRDGSLARIPASGRVWRTDLRIPLLPGGADFRLYHAPSAPAEGEPPGGVQPRGDVDPVLDLSLAELTEG